MRSLNGAVGVIIFNCVLNYNKISSSQRVSDKHRALGNYGNGKGKQQKIDMGPH